MGHLALLEQLAITAGLAALVTVLLAKARVPTVAGLLVVGALLGPFDLGLVRNAEAIETLAELGVVFLLFTIGLEFSTDRLRRVLGNAALGGLVQVLTTLAGGTGIATLLGHDLRRATFYGLACALSSTAIVLRALGDRGEVDAPHGRFTVGTLVLQDLCVIPMLLVVPALAGKGTASATALALGWALAKAALVVTAVLLAARLLLPRALRFVDAARSREVFLLAILTACVGTAWLTSLAGLSLALGAFLGGMVIADTDFQHRAMGDILPLRDALMSVFFISLGMLFDARLVLARPAAVGGLLLALLVGKGVLAALAALLVRLPARSAWLAGLSLAQFSEFGFVILKLGQAAGLTDRSTSGLILAAGILSMFFTPLLIALGPRITLAETLLAPLARWLRAHSLPEGGGVPATEGHTVIIGYGLAGRIVSRALGATNLRHIALELNIETVRRARAAGEPVEYADATSPEALAHANVAGARAVVVAINDPQAALRVVDTLRRVAPEVPLFVRTRHLAESERLLALGATDVIAEEVEASIEILVRLLRRLELPRNVIDRRVEAAREEHRTSRREVSVPRATLAEHEALAHLKIESLLVTSDSPCAGRTALELDLRRRTGALVVAIRREGKLLEHPGPQEPLRVGDVVYLVGSRESIRDALVLLGEPPPPGGP
ncbi:MAG: cation:proton antiporter [Deltaproteobacteria bacterium]|nr:cation:proton antiporter [Deltaproteobacteria bacterium]